MQDGWLLAKSFLHLFMDQDRVEVHKHAKKKKKKKTIPPPPPHPPKKKNIFFFYLIKN